MALTGTGEDYTRQQPKIADRCPTCGAQSLFIGSGGWLTCSVIGCKEPGVSVARDALRAALAEAQLERDELLAYMQTEHTGGAPCFVDCDGCELVARLLPRSDTPTTPAQMGEQGE